MLNHPAGCVVMMADLVLIDLVKHGDGILEEGGGGVNGLSEQA